MRQLLGLSFPSEPEPELEPEPVLELPVFTNRRPPGPVPRAATTGARVRRRDVVREAERNMLIVVRYERRTIGAGYKDGVGDINRVFMVYRGCCYMEVLV